MREKLPKIEFDKLQMYFGEPHVIDEESANGTITLLQPTIGDVVRVGEKKFYQTLNIFIVNTTSYRLPLWDMGIDWNEMTDFELFLLLLPQADQDILNLLFKDFNIKNLTWNPETKVIEDDISKWQINESVYNHISQYFRNVFNTYPEEKLTKEQTLKKWMIEKDRRELKNKEFLKEKGKDSDSSIQAIISACVNHPGFKYSVHDLMKVGVCEFYDSVQRLQIYEHSRATLGGLMGGMIDGSKIRPESYNFMREIK